jgi:hypothetical protein
LDSGLQIKEKTLKYRYGFLEKSSKASRIIKVSNEVIGEEMGATQTDVERVENNMLKWCGHV